MDEKQLKALYDSMSSTLELGEYNSFKNQISTDDRFRKAFYDEASSELELGDYNTFESAFKKKDGTVPAGVSQSPLPSQEIVDRYNTRVKKSNDLLNASIEKSRSEIAGDQLLNSKFSEFYSNASKLNSEGKVAERANLVYDFLKNNSAFDRDAFLSSQYAGAYHSGSKSLKEEYESSGLKDILSERQYNGLKSLSYGKESEYQDYLNKIKDPSLSDQDRRTLKLNLDRIGVEIDADAASSMVNEGVSVDSGVKLFEKTKQDKSLLDEEERQIEYENPYSLSTISNILGRALKRGVKMGQTADILNVTSDETGISVERLAELQKELQSSKSSKAYDNFVANPSLETFSKNPVGILLELTGESLAALYSHGATRMAAGAGSGAVLGSVVPGVGTAVGAGTGVISGLGMASLNLEYSSKILEGLANKGIDVTNAEQLKSAFADKKLVDELKKEGLQKGIPVAIFDMLSAGVAGKVASKPARTIAGKLLQGTAELGVQAGLGAAGEASGQIVSEGKITRPTDILMEAIGELGPGSVEVAYGTIVESAKAGKKPSVKDAVNVAANIKNADDVIDAGVASGNINVNEAQVIRSAIKDAEAKLPKVPADLPLESKASIVELLDEKNKLINESKNLDPVFKPAVDEKIKAIDEKILGLANSSQGQLEDQGIIDIPKEDQVQTSDVFRKPLYQKGVLSLDDRKKIVSENKANMSTEEVDINQISPTQRILDKQNINTANNDAGLPILVKDGNALFVLDGHHRIAAQIKAGSNTINARIINAPELSIIESPAPGKRLFNEPNPDAAVIENEFKASKGINTPEPAKITKLDEDRSKRIADEYEKLVDSPDDPEVQKAYQAMADETMEQFKAIDKSGVKVEIWEGKGEPYKNSEEMIKDVRDNKHMYIFSTEEGFGDNPITEKQREQNALLRDSGFKDVNGKPLLINDVFRFVHDYFGHTRLGNSFGAIGEENAWNVHARMYSPLARRAMTTETRGQNSWVNFNKSYRNPDGTMKKKGDEGYVPPAQRPFADQKMALLPEEFSNIEDSYSLKSEDKIDVALNESIDKASKSLSKAGIKFNVVDSSTRDQLSNAARGNQGLFVSEDGTIIIDKSKLANEIEAGLVVWHEASHPVMNIIRNTNRPLYDKVVSGLNKASRTNEDIFKAIEWAESQPEYDNVETQNDEAVVETIGRINSGLIDISTLDTGLRQSIIDFVNSVAKFFGIDPILNDTDLAAFKKTVGQVADALKTGRDIAEIVGEDNVSQTQAPTPQSKAVSIAKGTESLKRFGLPEGRNTTRKIGEALEKRTRGKYGVIARDDRSPDAVRKIASWMVEEVKYFLSEFGDKSGKGWYGEKFQKGLDKMADVFPELATGQNARDLFTMLVAVTSDGTEVMENFKQASQAYDYYKKNDKMPETASSQRAASYIINFRNIQNLIDQFDGDVAKMKDYLLQVSSISELNKKRKTEGLEALSTSWPASFEVPIAASIFGPKLGMFYANLSGMENYPTLDRWWSRTFNRYRGTLIPQVTRGRNKKGEALGIDAYREVAGLENASEDEVIANIIQDHDSYENKGYKNGTVAEKKANTLYKKLFVELNDAPFGKTDRKFMYDAFVETKKRLKAGGVDVSIADIQAILWYFEKNLYKKLGVTKPILGVSYEEAAAKTAQKYKDAGNTFSYEIKKEEQGETIEEIEEVEEEVQASVGNRGDIYNVSLPDNLINSVRTSLRKKAPDSSALDLLNQIQAAKKDDSLILDPEVDNFLSNGITLNDIGSLLINDEVFEDVRQVRNYFNNIGDLGILSRVQTSVGNRSEEDLRAPGTGKERNRALSSKFGDLDPETQAKIDDDAVTYFQRPNKQTEKAVQEFIDGQNIVDMADYVLSNPEIPEVSKVWMAAEVANRLNAEIAAAQDQNLKDALTEKQAAIYNEFAKKATSLGQAVQAFIAFKKDSNAVEFFLPKVLRQLKKAGADNVTDIQKADIVNLLKEVNNAADGLPKDKAIIKLSHYLAGIAPLKPIDVLQSLWYAKILSGITTQSTNFFANVFNTMFELPAVGLRLALRTGNPMALAYGIKGFGSGVFKGAINAADIVKSGVRSKEADKYFSESPLEYFTWSKWLGKKGEVLDKIPPLNFGAWKYVGRILSATDAFFSTANQEAIANMLAYAQTSDSKPGMQTFRKVNEILGNTKQNINDAQAQAIAEGFKPGTLQNKRRVLEIVSQRRGDDITSEADAIGKRITMNYDPEGWTKPLFDAVVGLQKSIPPIKMVIPFARIVANLTENALNYSPAGLVRAITGNRNYFNKENRLSNDERIDLVSKFSIGMGALVLLATKTGEDDDDWFEITAGGSNDPQKKYELQKGGWRPYTITFKDGTKLNYKDWPIAGILAGIGHMRDAKKYSFEDSTQLGLYSTGFFLNFYDKSLLSGLQDFFGIFDVKAGRGKYAPDTNASERAKKYAAQQVKSVAISNLSQQAGKLYSELVTGDPQRDAKTFMEVIYRDIPVLNDGIRPIIDVFGDPVKYNTTERLTPVMSDPKKEEIIKWLNENKLFVGVPKKRNIFDMETLTERPMTDDEYYEYRKIAGQETKKWIMEFMDMIKDEDREISESAFENAKEVAREFAYMEIAMK